MDLQRKSLPFEVKSIDDDGTFTLYAAVLGNVDRQGEVIAPGAFQNLEAFTRDGWGDVNHAWQGLGIATIDAASEDGIGLKIVGRFHSTQDAQDVRTKAKERKERGKTVSCSIGYREVLVENEVRDEKRVRVLKAIELYEFSFVALPANTSAQVVDVKDALGTKSGRAVSKSNHEFLCDMHKCWAKHASEATTRAADFKAWLDSHAPKATDADGDDAEPDNDADDLDEKRLQLRRRAAKSRAALSTLN